MIVRGKVVAQKFNDGLNSQYKAVMLESGGDSFRLRMENGKYVSVDPELADLVGKNVELDVTQLNKTLMVKKFTILP